jgi:hypothetical protein
MIKFKIENSDKEYQMPTCWDEVTVKQFFELIAWDESDFIRMVSVLSGCEYDDLFITKTNDLDQMLYPHTKWIETPIQLKDSVHLITVGDKSYEVPKDMKWMTFGQKLGMVKRMNDEIEKHKNTLGATPYVVACWLLSKEKKKFDNDECLQYEKDVVSKLGIVDVATIGNFFLSSLLKSRSVKERYSKVSQLLNRFKQALTGLTSSKKQTPLMH